MRFVFLQHDLPRSATKRSHVDLMFECVDGLRTWSIDSWPPGDPGSAAIELSLHRREYLEYEGAVAENRGHVKRLDRGDYIEIEANADLFLVRIEGQRWNGMVRMTPQTHPSWWVSFSSDHEPGST